MSVHPSLQFKLPGSYYVNSFTENKFNILPDLWQNSFLHNRTEIPDIKNLKFQVRYPITQVSAERVLDISSCFKVSVFESKFNTAVRTH